MVADGDGRAHVLPASKPLKSVNLNSEAVLLVGDSVRVGESPTAQRWAVATRLLAGSLMSQPS